MGEALSAETRHGSLDYLSDEPWIELEEARARSSNPTSVSARYHREEGFSLADVYEETGTILGSGMSGDVRLALGRHDGRKYALKSFNKQAMKAESLKLLKREVEVYLSVDHPGIARLCDVYESTDKLTMVMECCTGGELFEKLLEQERCCFPEQDAAAAAEQMLRTVSYLHKHNIVHRDLKLENFLYATTEANAALKLIDFGFAKVWGQSMPPMRTCCGSIAYISPDALNGDGYTCKTDIWSLGVIVFMLLAGYAPFSGTARVIKAQIKAGDVDWSSKNKWQHVSHEALDFVKYLLTRDPDERPEASVALAHPWLLQRAATRASAMPVLPMEVLSSMRQYANASKLRQVALQVLVRELVPEDTCDLVALFLSLDSKSSGTVSLEELAAAIRAQKSEKARDAMWGLFSLWPAAQTSTSASPTSTGPRSKPQSTSQEDLALLEAVELFRALDCSGAGECYASEFLAAASATLPRPHENVMRRAFARLDADGSGAVGVGDLQCALGGTPQAAEELLVTSGALLDRCGELGFAAFSRMVQGGGAQATSPPAHMLARM